ncbi:MAG: hypothetical protein AAEJ52_01650 [Myxococcota bacterium]
MKFGRPVLVGIGGLLVVVIGVLLYLYTNLDAIVKREIESYGSQLTGTTVWVESVSISPTSGKGTLRGLHISNPAGFASEDAFSLDEISLEIRPSTIAGNPVVIDSIVVRSPVIHYELSLQGSSNIGTITSNVRNSSGSHSSNSSNSNDRRLSVRRFIFEGGQMDANTKALLGKKIEVRLPRLSMSDIGGSGGAPPSVVGEQILSAYLSKILFVVATSQLERGVESQAAAVIKTAIPGKAGDALGKLVDNVFDVLPGQGGDK